MQNPGPPQPSAEEKLEMLIGMVFNIQDTLSNLNIRLNALEVILVSEDDRAQELREKAFGIRNGATPEDLEKITRDFVVPTIRKAMEEAHAARQRAMEEASSTIISPHTGQPVQSSPGLIGIDGGKEDA